MGLFERLASRQLIVVTGKGGVGKTVITAVLGSLLADLGRRVLLLEVDPRESLHQVFDVPPSGGEIVRITAPVQDRDGAAPWSLSLQNLQPRRVIEDLVRQHLHIELLTRRVMASPVFQHFIEGAPGLKELAVLSEAERVVRPRGKGRSAHAAFDLVVLDAPATGHGVSLLAAPHLVAEVIERGPIGAQARALTSLVSDPQRTGIVVVTQAEEMPAHETLELREALEEQVGRTPELLVVNALYPPFPTAAIEGSPDDRFLIDLWRRRREVNERELAHLAAAWQGSKLELPMLPADRGLRLLAALRHEMLAQLDPAA
jgi:anion-transporting  ArsA/GET3 family ATPase